MLLEEALMATADPRERAAVALNQMREAMQQTKSLMEETSAKIRPMLTPEQQKTLDEAKNDRRGGGREGRHGGGRHGADGAGTDDDNG